jgi:hypothetical protein
VGWLTEGKYGRGFVVVDGVDDGEGDAGSDIHVGGGDEDLGLLMAIVIRLCPQACSRGRKRCRR